MRTQRWTIHLALALALSSWGRVAGAQDLPPSEVIKNRIHNFKEIGTAFKAINDELKSKEPYLPSIQESAQQIESLGSEMRMWFPPGSGPVAEPEKGIIDTILGWFSSDEANDEGKTHAKPIVWTQRAKFEQAQHKFHAQAVKMNEVAQSGSTAAVGAQFKILGGTCKSCHDTFREKLDEE